MDRRGFLGLLAVGLAVSVTGCAAREDEAATADPAALTWGVLGVPRRPAVPRGTTFPRDGAVLYQAPRRGRGIALTIDDGYDRDTVAAYVEFAAASGIHLTFNPNGVYAAEWERHAGVLRPLIEKRQVQIGNHTFRHPDLRRLADGDVRAEIERNEAWIRATFGTSSRPYLRPPYGYYDERIRTLAADVGFPGLLLWNGTFGDYEALTPAALLAQARRYLQPRSVFLGHANHPTVTQLFPEIVRLIKQRGLEPQTLDEMFGTRRPAPGA